MISAQTDMAVLEQACRNVRGIIWFFERDSWGSGYMFGWVQIGRREFANNIRIIRAEYNRLMRLKKSKKRWRAA